MANAIGIFLNSQNHIMKNHVRQGIAVPKYASFEVPNMKFCGE